MAVVNDCLFDMEAQSRGSPVGLELSRSCCLVHGTQRQGISCTFQGAAFPFANV